MELDGYNFIEGDNVEVYDHMGKHTLCTMVQTNKAAQEQGHAIAMQVAAMKPVALNQESVPRCSHGPRASMSSCVPEALAGNFTIERSMFPFSTRV